MPTFVQSNGDSGSASLFTLSMLSGNIAPGNQVYVFYRTAGTMTLTAITLPGGEVPTLLTSITEAGGNKIAVYRTLSAVGGGTDLNLTFDVSGVAQYSMIEYTGGGAEIAVGNFVEQTTSTSHTAPSTTATAAGQLAVSFTSINTAVSIGPGGTEIERMDQGRLQIEEKLTTGSGSVANVVTLGSTATASLAQVLLGDTSLIPQILLW